MATDIKVYNIRHTKGTTWRFAFTWKEKIDDVVTTKNLTGYTAKLQIRKKGATTAMASLSSAAGTIVLGGAAGTVVATLSAEASNSLSTGAAVWSIEFTSPSGDVYEKLRGQFFVEEEYTV